jgi:CRP-like cAMP-binding protein
MHLDDSSLEKLSVCSFFAGFTPKEIETVLSNKHIRIRAFESEQYAVMAGDICDDLPLIITGSVRGEMGDYFGRIVKIEDIKAPSMLASAFIFGTENKYPVDIIANEPAVILFIPRESLLKIFKENPEIMRNFLNDISNRTQFLSKKIRFLAFKTLREKLAQYLMELSLKQKSEKIKLPVTHSKLADFFGTTRPSLGRTMAGLKNEKIIETHRNEIKILNRKKLSELSNR